jgi:hypothetical protein
MLDCSSPKPVECFDQDGLFANCIVATECFAQEIFPGPCRWRVRFDGVPTDWSGVPESERWQGPESTGDSPPVGSPPTSNAGSEE